MVYLFSILVNAIFTDLEDVQLKKSDMSLNLFRSKIITTTTNDKQTVINSTLILKLNMLKRA